MCKISRCYKSKVESVLHLVLQAHILFYSFFQIFDMKFFKNQDKRSVIFPHGTIVFFGR